MYPSFTCPTSRALDRLYIFLFMSDKYSIPPTLLRAFAPGNAHASVTQRHLPIFRLLPHTPPCLTSSMQPHTSPYQILLWHASGNSQRYHSVLAVVHVGPRTSSTHLDGYFRSACHGFSHITSCPPNSLTGLRVRHFSTRIISTQLRQQRFPYNVTRRPCFPSCIPAVDCPSTLRPRAVIFLSDAIRRME